MFVFISTSIRRQFEFVQSEWVNNGIFIGSGGDKDPIAGAHEGTGKFIVPRKPVRRHTRWWGTLFYAKHTRPAMARRFRHMTEEQLWLNLITM